MGYRRVVEEAVFDRLGRPTFFAEAVDLILGRIAARIAEKNSEATARRKSLCASAPQLSWMRELAQEEAVQVN
jgi:hypothetical protein